MSSVRFGQTLSLFLLFLSWQNVQGQWLSDEQAIMGTLVKVELWHENGQQGKILIDQVMTEMHRIDDLMSSYKKGSDVYRINTEADKSPITITEELAALIARSLKVSDLTKGAFDISYASVGHLFDYRKKIRPTQTEVKQAVSAVNYRYIKLDLANHRFSFEKKGMRLDLGGIAKGYAVDKGVQLLQSQGIQHAIVSAGGDSRIIGDRRGRPWMVGIRHPRLKQANAAVLPLQNEALSTSGDYERYFMEAGKRYHHIINPQSGGSASELQSVTILGPDATTTDALSTSVFVMGKDKGLALVEALTGIEAVIIDRHGQLFFSSGLRHISTPDKAQVLH